MSKIYFVNKMRKSLFLLHTLKSLLCPCTLINILTLVPYVLECFCLYVRDFLGCKHEFVYRCARTESKNTGKSSLFNVNSLHSHVRKVSIIWAEQCMKACNIFLRWLLIKLLLFMAFKISFICFIFSRIMPNPHIDCKFNK